MHSNVQSALKGGSRAIRMVHHRGPFLIYLVAIVALVGCIFCFGWTRTWSAVFVPPGTVAFLDMRFIQEAVISARQGFDPQVFNQFNYPRIWLQIGETLNLPEEPNFILFSSLMVLSFITVCASVLYSFPSYGLLACALSTATLHGIERGNIDLIMFCLVFASVLLFPRIASPVPILIATALKLYPIFGLGLFLVKGQLRLLLASLIIVIATFLSNWHDLPTIQSLTPVGAYEAYGFPSLATYFSARNLPTWMFNGLALVICAAAAVVVVYLYKIRDIRRNEGFEFDLFLVGGSIYVGTFIFSSNWDYRLMFLIFCVPFLQIARPWFARLLVIAIVIAMNEKVIHPLLGRAGFGMVSFAKIGLFVVLIGYLTTLILFTFRRDPIPSSFVFD